MITGSVDNLPGIFNMDTSLALFTRFSEKLFWSHESVPG